MSRFRIDLVAQAVLVSVLSFAATSYAREAMRAAPSARDRQARVAVATVTVPARIAAAGTSRDAVSPDGARGGCRVVRVVYPGLREAPDACRPQ